MAKPARLEILARRPGTVIGKIGTELFPRHAVIGEYLRPLVHVDIHLRHDLESAMGMLKFHARPNIPEGVNLVTPAKRCGLHADRVLQALLERRRPRDEMQYVMAMQYITGVLVGRFVMDAIAHALAHVHTDCESPVWEK